ncbi:hypothetical protein [Micromonospora endolithica]|uniref:Uncharacterized protein n=1 Tax=Micromonospora endolithica TaxID=230091 RepID=A0A3A9ZHM5_9ACTN|nr:hypothetical protein [Micromonospora endolithica]RKN47753.1 hypothetical protein D7223_13475 [Micromonospora endolithica]TWJ21429.1 hypothetical protein JD76_01539 [Micromonospora endolithica]
MTTTLHRAAGWHRPLMVLVAAMAVLAVVTAVGVVADPRVLTGAPIWLKPFKFAVSFVLYGLTLAWMLSLLPRRSRVAEWAGTVVVAMALAEMVVIVGQVLRGTTSHYNDTTPLNAALWATMGIAIMVLFAAHLLIAIVLLRRPAADRVARYAVGLGLGLSLLGMLAAVPMVLPAQEPGIEGIAGAHSVGVPDGGPGLPLVGWSTTGGDLRIGHFVGLHALQALPILAILLNRFLRNRLDQRTRVRLVVVAGVAYGVLTVLLTWQALRGQPLLRPDAVTLAAATALAASTATAVGVVLALRRGPEPAPAAQAGRGGPVPAVSA